MAVTRVDGIATIGDVARAANVSRATVSRVMNGKPNVDAELALRVRAAAEALQYRPSTTARSLSLGRTNTVAVTMPDLTNPMFQETLRGVTTAAAAQGYRVLVADTAGDPSVEVESALDARSRCDAIVMISPRLAEPALRDLLHDLSPAVVINRRQDGQTPTISVDYGAGIRSILTHLTSLGHRDVLYLSGPALSASNQLRIDALREFAAQRTDLRVREHTAGASIEAGYASGEAVIASGATAVVAYNDLVAFGLLARLNDLGVGVPADISVTGFDGIEFAQFAQPPLTTAAVSQSDLGAAAWDMLSAVLAGQTPADPPLVQPELIVRASTRIVSELLSRRPIPGSGLATQPRVLTSFAWAADESVGGWVLRGSASDGSTTEVVRASTGSDLPTVHSPRPFLHPVRTADGIDLTERNPQRHRQQHGVSMAVAMVNGTSYWGGRTYLRGEGPTLLQNHGRQVATNTSLDGASLHQSVTWFDEHERPQLTEERITRGAALGPAGWSLQWTSHLTASHGDLIIESPATQGRVGAGYGGIFWRLGPSTSSTVFGPGLTREHEVHGSTAPWIAFVQHGADRAVTLVLAQHPDLVLPWFVRAEEWFGAGPALAWDTPRAITHGQKLTLGLAGIAVDGVLDADAAAELATRAWE